MSGRNKKVIKEDDLRKGLIKKLENAKTKKSKTVYFSDIEISWLIHTIVNYPYWLYNCDFLDGEKTN